MREIIFFLCFLILVLSHIGSSSARFTTPPVERIMARCITDSELATAITSLSREYKEVQSAQRSLRQWSEQSSACRQRIISALMQAMDKPDLDISLDQASANLWREGAILLGDLKAKRSLDLLLAHIKMTDGSWSSTMSQQPALGGIIRMGPIAVPKLKSLLRNQDWQTRHYAVFCLASIGGLSARRAIETALPMESHPCVRRLMTLSIKTIDVKHGGLKQDDGEWAKAFMCHPESPAAD